MKADIFVSTFILHLQLSVIRRENIKDYDDMQSRLTSIESMANNLKTAIDELNEKVTHYKKVAGYLETYNKYAEIMLENHNVNPDIDVSKVWDLIRDKNKIVAEKTNNYNNLKNKVDNLKEAVKVINEINVNRSREMNRNKGLMK